MAEKKSSKKASPRQKPCDTAEDDLQRLGDDLMLKTDAMLQVLSFIDSVGTLVRNGKERKEHEAISIRCLKKMFLGTGKTKMSAYFKQLNRFIAREIETKTRRRG